MSRKDEQFKAIQSAFLEFAVDYPQSALSLLSGLLVGMVEYSIEKNGGNSKQEIKIAGGDRDIIIAAIPERKAD